MKDVAQYIDHTVLKADAVTADIEKICKEAVEYNFKTVCIQPYWISYAKEELQPEYHRLLTDIFIHLNIRNSIMHGSGEAFLKVLLT